LGWGGQTIFGSRFCGLVGGIPPFGGANLSVLEVFFCFVGPKKNSFQVGFFFGCGNFSTFLGDLWPPPHGGAFCGLAPWGVGGWFTEKPLGIFNPGVWWVFLSPPEGGGTKGVCFFFFCGGGGLLKLAGVKPGFPLGFIQIFFFSVWEDPRQTFFLLGNPNQLPPEPRIWVSPFFFFFFVRGGFFWCNLGGFGCFSLGFLWGCGGGGGVVPFFPRSFLTRGFFLPHWSP